MSLLIHFSHCLYGLLMSSLSYSENSLLIGRPSLPVHSETTSKRPPLLGELGWMFVELEVVWAEAVCLRRGKYGCGGAYAGVPPKHED